MIKIKFIDFWSDLPIERNTFTWLLGRIFKEEILVVTNTFQKCDILFLSTHKPKITSLRSFLGKIFWFFKNLINLHLTLNTIWVSGEYRKLPKREHNLYMSFYSDNFDKKNIYFPTWFMMENALEGKSYSAMMDRLGITIDMKNLLKNRSQIRKLHNNQIGFFVTNYDAYRNNLVHVLRKNNLSITLLGRNFDSGYIEFKSSFSNCFNFILCPENRFEENYVSEKLIEAYLLNAIPIWAGKDTLNYFNKNAIINILDFPSIQDLSKYLLFLLNDLDEFNKIYKQPLLNKLPSIKIFEDIFKKNLYFH